MGPRCIVTHCRDFKKKSVSLHRFPKDKGVKKRWIRAVFGSGFDCDSLTDNHRICSTHFEESDFSQTSRTYSSLGIQYRVFLNPHAVPTIFKSPGNDDEHQETTKKYLDECIGTDESAVSIPLEKEMAQSETSFSDAAEVQIMDDCNDDCAVSTAFEKGIAEIGPPHGDAIVGEVINDTLPGAEMELEQSEINHQPRSQVQREENLEVHTSSTSVTHKEEKCQCQKCTVQTKVKGIQINIKAPCRRVSKGSQTLAKHHIQYRTSATQVYGSDRQSGPTYTSTPRKSAPPPSCVGSPALDSTFRTLSSGVYTEDLDDPDYEPEQSFFSENEADTSHTNSGDPCKQRKFLVFEDNLMELFKTCQLCHHTTKTDICQQRGTYIAVRQVCDCGHVRRWESQPHIRSIPAGNVLLSSAIFIF